LISMSSSVSTADSIADWKVSQLWNALSVHSSPERNAVLGTLQQCMPDIQRILSQGGTAPSDFTLHDPGHSFRVAERMLWLIPATTKDILSIYELALLLLAAYLHDIGMTPTGKKVSEHFQFLLIGNPGELTQAELGYLQEWLDNTQDGLVPPICKSLPTAADIQTARRLTAHYCRYQHNNWSSEWIHNNLSDLKLGSYENWIEDLTNLCASHHYGYEQLVTKRFDPRFVEPRGTIVHLRYLACVLRIADILEFDPERTPDVIFRHRDISTDSAIYWWKDHDVTLLRPDKTRLILYGRPSNAYIHHAIEQLADQIDTELALCVRIDAEKPFLVGPASGIILFHSWDFPSALERNIEAKGDNYEYIDGSFRPDTKRLLDLLSGVRFYNTPLAAFRELLQNAFDAVREQIAYERLRQHDSQNPDWDVRLQNVHYVRMAVRIEDDIVWVSCTDSGVGMTKAHIRDHLLVSGRSKRHDFLDLQRRCTANGFRLVRTGEFGIGALSYFMVADKVKITTRRTQEAGSYELTGWSFETDGVEAFGELRREQSAGPGTTVSFRIRKDMYHGDWLAWTGKLREYLLETVAYTPCQLFLDIVGRPELRLHLKPGWVKGEADFIRMVLEDLDRERENRGSLEFNDEVTQAIRWRVEEGFLPHDAGRYRISMPYFQLKGGICLGFFREESGGRDIVIKPLRHNHGYLPKGRLFHSWKGIGFGESRFNDWYLPREVDGSSNDKHWGDGLAEVDWYSSETGTLSANRNNLEQSDFGKKMLSWLYARANAIQTELAVENSTSQYSLMNYRFAWVPTLPPGPLYWIFPASGQSQKSRIFAWVELIVSRLFESRDHVVTSELRIFQLPAISTSSFPYPDSEMIFRENEVTLVPPVSILRPQITGNPDSRVGFCSPRTAPTLIAKAPTQPVAIWCDLGVSLMSSSHKHKVVRFPAEWRNICAIRFSGYSGEIGDEIVWNEAHPIIQMVSVDAEKWVRKTKWPSKEIAKETLATSTAAELASDPTKCAAWILLFIEGREWEAWNSFVAANPDTAKGMWEKLFRGRVEPDCIYEEKILVIDQAFPFSSVGIVTPDVYKRDDFLLLSNKYTSAVTPEWTVGRKRDKRRFIYRLFRWIRIGVKLIVAVPLLLLFLLYVVIRKRKRQSAEG
jgi:hypothetical protein